MTAQSSTHLTPPRKRRPRTLKVVHLGIGGSSAPREYRMLKLNEREFRAARQAIKFARDRIKANGGLYGPSTIDNYAGRAGTDWAKKLLKPGAPKWSCNEALELSAAVEKCELARVTKRLCVLNDGISEAELKRVYRGYREGTIAQANEKTGEVVGALAVVRGGAIPADYDDWLSGQGDYDTLSALLGMRHALIRRQVAAQRTRDGEPYTCAMLYEPDAAQAIASEIARYLADQNLIHGARKNQHRLAYDALLKLFVEPDAEDVSFREGCRWAFWSHFRRYDVEAVIEIERRISMLRTDIAAAVSSPPDDRLREVKTVENGKYVSRFDGDPRAAWEPFMPPRVAEAAPSIELRNKSKARSNKSKTR